MSSSSATVAVDKATSDLLIGPDWTMNIDICDSINSHRWQAKDVVKALKKRLQHRNPKVQLLGLTLLETMVKNCGDIVHFQIADRDILQEMIKIARKKMDLHVRDKILVLLDSWQEAFGGAGGKYPQYYCAYEELRRSGVQFPERSRDAAPIFTPPVAPSVPRHSHAGYGMPSDTSRRLDESMASEKENLSFSNLDSMRSVQELLSDMLQAVNPTDREAIKDEVIVDLVSRCRSNQKKLMQMVTSTGDERLLGQGLELNDNLQSVLAKHDAIASGSPLPAEVIINSASPVPTEVRDASPRSNPAATSVASATSSQLEEEEEEDDDFAQLARRRTKASTMSSETSVPGDGAAPPPSTSSPSNALVLTAPPPAVRTSAATKEQDIIDLLSITLSTTSVSPHAAQSNTNQTMNQVPFSTASEGNPYGSPVYTESQGRAAYSNYVAPWAQPQPQQWAAQQAPPQPQPWTGQQSQPRPEQWAAQQSQPQPQQWAAQQPQQQPQQWDAQQPQPWAEQQAQPQPQPWVQHQAQPQEARVQPQTWAEQQAPQQPQQQPQPQAQAQHQAQPQQSQPRPWAQHQPHPQSQSQPWARPESQPQPQPWMQQEARTQTQPQSQPWAPQPQSQQWGQQQAQGQSQAWAQQQQQQSQPKSVAPQQSFNYPPPPWATATSTTTQVAKSLQSHNSFPARVSNGLTISEGHKPFIPSYRLFEDLNVLGGSDGTGNNSPKMSGQSMLGGRK